MTNIPDLIARLEAADEGSLELDVAVGKAIGLCVYEPFELAAGGVEIQCENEYGAIIRLPHYTTSLDAITALIAEVLPDMWWVLNSGVQNGLPGVSAGGYDWLDRWGEHNYGRTPPLALCIALLRALQARDS